MFKFDFQLEEDEEELQIPSQAHAGPSTSTPILPSPPVEEGDQRCYHIPLDELIKSLPEEISYSPLSLPFIDTPLLRRDLFDARFQLYNKQEDEQPAGDEKKDEGDEYVDAKTDLIPGLYEGGLKSWEGGVDLVEVISSIGDQEGVGRWVQGGRVLEVGCGTALPTLYLLRSLLSTSSSASSAKTTLHMQDYNSLVLSLVTLPNLILATLPYLPPEVLHLPTEEEDVEEVIPDLENPGNLVLSPQLVEGFKELLQQRNIELKFSYGHWAGLARDLQKEGEEGYGLVLTAETIYAEASNASLLDVLRQAIRRTNGNSGEKVQKEEIRLEDSLGHLKVDDEWKVKGLREQGDGFVLVAAKILYFGVGGGLTAFLNRVEDNGGWWKGVKDWTKGVGRKVVQVGW
ncbi:hypothetical protein I302_101859 [Kwoniella bestiolae CBS 10118]|uniref:protein-histidine N-methyltransferase n=1 Tax=Kwoniella bestiolae CBS 10118 TaxID=1296100 RepID=A0A1B9GDG1_9TREE|nr:hypothetical protein I302_00538 [Kwoniella bestiolae CBS 10118]OCF29047.1 hypothetical protein I302_00538 [Kwoniella bestiolae CBS 10118]